MAETGDPGLDLLNDALGVVADGIDSGILRLSGTPKWRR